SHTTSSRLAVTDPMIAPSVFAAYTPPTRRAGSFPPAATDDNASGKLAPQRMAPGSTAQRQRTKSSWKLNQGSVEIDGLIGQYGSDCVSMYAVHAIATQSSIWHHPSAGRGRAMRPAIADPRLLPIPSPSRKTARMSENV